MPVSEMMYQKKIKAFMKSPIVKWVEVCAKKIDAMPNEHPITYDFLLDGILIHQIFRRMKIYVADDVIAEPRDPSDVCDKNDETRRRSSNLKKIMYNIRYYLVNEKEHVILRTPNVNRLIKASSRNTEELACLLHLLLGCAVTCPEKDYLVNNVIESLDGDEQTAVAQCVMKVLNAPTYILTYEMLLFSSDDYMIRDNNAKMILEHLRQLHAERKALYELVRKRKILSHDDDDDDDDCYSEISLKKIKRALMDHDYGGDYPGDEWTREQRNDRCRLLQIKREKEQQQQQDVTEKNVKPIQVRHNFDNTSEKSDRELECLNNELKLEVLNDDNNNSYRQGELSQVDEGEDKTLPIKNKKHLESEHDLGQLERQLNEFGGTCWNESSSVAVCDDDANLELRPPKREMMIMRETTSIIQYKAKIDKKDENGEDSNTSKYLMDKQLVVKSSQTQMAQSECSIVNHQVQQNRDRVNEWRVPYPNDNYDNDDKDDKILLALRAGLNSEQAEVQSLLDSVRGLETRYDEVIGKNEMLSLKIVEKSRELNEAIDELDKLKDDFERLFGQREMLVGRCRLLELGYAKQRVLLVARQQEIERRGGEIERLRKRCDDYSQSLSKQAREKRNLSEANAALRSQNQNLLARAMSDLQAYRDECRESVEKLRARAREQLEEKIAKQQQQQQQQEQQQQQQVLFDERPPSSTRLTTKMNVVKEALMDGIRLLRKVRRRSSDRVGNGVESVNTTFEYTRADDDRSSNDDEAGYLDLSGNRNAVTANVLYERRHNVCCNKNLGIIV